MGNQTEMKVSAFLPNYSFSDDCRFTGRWKVEKVIDMSDLGDSISYNLLVEVEYDVVENKGKGFFWATKVKKTKRCFIRDRDIESIKIVEDLPINGECASNQSEK